MIESHSLHFGGTILKVPARIGSYALACARRIAYAREQEEKAGLWIGENRL